MPDPTGFLKHQRELPPLRPVSERVKDFRDVYTRAGDDLIRTQASRCMNCGIPYCHSGCPLGNQIPDFNDHVRAGHWDAAANILHATNNFPEFTGRLCPAPCEGSCTVGIHDDPVTIKQVEVEIVDRLIKWEGLKPYPVAESSGHSVGVIGGGPAGMAAAQQLARAGHAVTLYERSDAVGGMMRYGIPDFKIEKDHLDRRIAQMQAEGVTIVTNCAVGVTVTMEELRQKHDAILMTCGAHEARDVPTTPGRQLGGIHQAMEFLTGVNKVVAGKLDEAPITADGKHVIVVGGGDTAADCLGTSTRQGAKSVHLVEVVPQPPDERDPVSNPWPTWPMILRSNSSHEEGGERLFSTAVQEFIGDEAGNVRAVRLVDVKVDMSAGFRVVELPGTEREIPADLVLLAIGFSGTDAVPALTQLGLERGPRGTVTTDAEWQTDVPGVFAAGDMRRGPSLIVWAIAEGRSAAAAVHRYLGSAGNLPAPVQPGSMALSAR